MAGSASCCGALRKFVLSPGPQSIPLERSPGKRVLPPTELETRVNYVHTRLLACLLACLGSRTPARQPARQPARALAYARAQSHPLGRRIRFSGTRAEQFLWAFR